MATESTFIQAGIVGAGLMGRWHAWAIKRAGGCLSAVMDLDPDAAQRLAASYRGAKSFSDVERMLNRTDLNALHICTPPSTHYKIAEIAIDAGLNLLIDKPVTPMAADTERLFNRAAARGVLMCPVHQFIFQNGVLKARELLRRIGQPVHMEGTLCSAGGTLAGVGAIPDEVVGDRSPLLDEIVADILPHPLSLIQMFLPTGLLDEDWVAVRSRHGELRAVCEMSGITLYIFISMNARPTECSFKIVGTEGTIHLDLFHGFAFMEPGKVSRLRKTIHPFDLSIRRLSAATLNLGHRIIRWEPAYPGLKRLVGSFYEAVRTGAESPISQDDAIAIARVRDLLIRNAGLLRKEQEHMGS